MEQTHPKKRYHEVDSFQDFSPEDEASYYLGDHFELGGVDFGAPESGEVEEKSRNLSRFGERVWNEKDYAGFGPRSYRRSDSDVFHEVCEALTDNPRLDASQIEVTIDSGCVHLKGKVQSRRDKREAERCVEYLPGVRDVMNELRFD